MNNWHCPRCHRPFKHKNQAHSCVSLSPDIHLDNRSPNVRRVYDTLADHVQGFGEVKISTTKSTIMFVARSTFLAVKPKHNWLDIEFLLDEEVNEYPITKTFRANKSRVAHFVRLESPKDVTRKLLCLLKQSYNLTSRP